MPANQPSIQQPQWVDITDFSPGAFNHSGTVLPASDRLMPGKQGAHDPDKTFGCIAIPGGGLAALPRMDKQYTWPANFSATGPSYLVGLLIHDELGSGNTEAILICEYDDGTTHSWQAVSYILETAAANQIQLNTTTSSPGIFGAPYPAMTRMSKTNPGTKPFFPIVVFPCGVDATPGILHEYVYPDPTASVFGSSYAALDLITGAAGSRSSVPGQTIVHQGRVVVLAGTNTPWTGGDIFFTNETINFTDPATTIALGNQQEIVVPEQPFGYGGWGSVSAGELFLIKKRNGGVVITGDISDPSVTFLPGVTPTGNFVGQAGATPFGLVYCSEDNGAWLWNGSNTSQKISAQLDDSFFLPPEFVPMDSNNYGYYVGVYGDRILISNNWLYDTGTSSWWKYYPDENQGGTNLFWTQVVNGNFIYAAPLGFGHGVPTGQNFLFRFNPALPTSLYQWTSLPIELANEDRVVDIREIVVRVSDTETDGSFIVRILDQGETIESTASTDVAAGGPQFFRFNFAALGLIRPQVQIGVNNLGSDDMPIIHAISFKYQVRAHVGTSN